MVAGLGVVYGRHIVRFFSQYYKPALFLLIGLAVVGGILALIQYYRYRNRTTDDRGEQSLRRESA
jgi:hypothetical protein